MKKQTDLLKEPKKNKPFIFTCLFITIIIVFQIISCSKISQEEQFELKLNLVEKTPVNPLTVKPSESTRYGVLDYLTKMVDSSLFITLIQKEPMKGVDNEQIILSKEGDLDYIYYDNGSETIQIWWDRKVTGTIRLLIVGKEFLIEPSEQGSPWKFVIGNEEELMVYALILKKIAAIAADFDQYFFQPYKVYTGVMPLGPVKLTLKDLKLSAVSESEDPLCNGPVMQSDRFYAYNQDDCCNNLANPDVNAKCSNSSCTECCPPIYCYWEGILGEYFGYCESTGTSCTE